MNRCNICLEETCGGKKNCNCDTCSNLKECPKFLNATIRITNKCTQKCNHCCFKSSPDSKVFMSIDTARKISTFIKSNNIISINVMGGEFFCNMDWYEIFNTLVENVLVMRVVSNSDWFSSESTKEKLKRFVEVSGNKVIFSLSKDKWHSNEFVEMGEEFLKSIGAKYNIETPNESDDMSLVPLGRCMDVCNVYSMFGCYCHNTKNMYSFMIDEIGTIYKCSFGVFSYAVIDDYLDGGFDKRFKGFNKKFYSMFIPSCRSCYNQVRMLDLDEKRKSTNNRPLIISYD